MGRGLVHFTDGLSAVFQRMAKALKPGSPLAFTYHHNTLEAYLPIAVAILDSGLTCSASLPCPAEMGASIHIHGTGSSIVDTIFVCRFTGSVPKKWIIDSPEGVADLVREDTQKLKAGNVNPTQGGIRCLIHGHLVRLAIWFLRKLWQKEPRAPEKLGRIEEWVQKFGGPSVVQTYLSRDLEDAPKFQWAELRENRPIYEGSESEISF
jgi:hypothetical protein